MRSVLKVAILTVVGLGSLSACGGSSFSGAASGTGGASNTGGASSTGPTLDQVPQYYAEGACAALNRCNQAMASIMLGSNDCTSLVANQAINASLPGMQAAVAAGTVTYAPSVLSDCKAAVDAAGCSVSDNPYMVACESALTGTVDEGGACSIDEECKGDLYCKYSGNCPGTCTQREAEGALCRADKNCQSGLTCLASSDSSGKCAVKPKLGEECGYDLPGTCATQSSGAGVVCWGASSSKRGKCVAIDAIASQAIGSDCSVPTGSLCVAGASCQIATLLLTGTCVASVASGTSCTLAFPDPCPSDQYCTATGATAPGNCELLPLDGKPCATALVAVFSNKVCAAAHVCVSGTCIKLRANGATCTSNAVCYSGRCDSQSQLCVPNQNCGP